MLSGALRLSWGLTVIPGRLRTTPPKDKYGLRDETGNMSSIAAQNGDTVSVHYLGKFPGGRVFDTSMKQEAINAGIFNPARDYKPLQVVLGAHQVISGFEEALVGMKVNETKEVTLPPEKAYGRGGGHPMSGKTLQFRLLVTNIKRP